MYSVHSSCTTHSQSGSSWSGISELNVHPFPAPWQSMTTTSVAPAGLRAAHARVDLLGVELAAFLVERLAAGTCSHLTIPETPSMSLMMWTRIGG